MGRALRVAAVVGLLCHLVVSPARAQELSTGSLVNPGDVVTAGANGVASIAVQLAGTWSGSIAFEATGDGGTTWWPVTATDQNAAAISPSVQTASTTGLWVIPNYGFTGIRILALAMASGTVTVTLTRGIDVPPTRPCNALLRSANRC